MRRAPLLLTCAALAVGCAKTVEDELPFRTDALVSGAGGMGGSFEPAPGDARFLFFTVGGQGFLASAAGTDARPICDAATLRVDALGERVLCVPASGDSPMTLYDVLASESIATYADWRDSPFGSPQLSQDGSRVAYPTINDEGKRVVQVRDDGENVVGETRGNGVIGFADDRTLVIESNGAKVWRIGEAAIEIPGGNARPAGPDPSGAVYEVVSPDFKAYFLDAETGRSRDLGPGQIGDVRGTRILVHETSLEGVNTATLLDVADPSFAADIPIPMIPFDRVLQARLVGKGRVLIEQAGLAIACESARGFSLHTELYDVRGESSRPIAEGQGPHIAAVDGNARLALVVDVDACGRSQGTGRVGEIGDDEPEELAALLQGEPVGKATISPDGRFVAVSVADGVRVIDLPSDLTRSAASGGPGGELHFR